MLLEKAYLQKDLNYEWARKKVKKILCNLLTTFFTFSQHVNRNKNYFCKQKNGKVPKLFILSAS